LTFVAAQTLDGARYLEHYTHAKKVAVIPNWIELPLTRQPPNVNPPANIGCDNRLLIGVGRLHPVKKFDRLIVAFSSIADKHPHWSLFILGEGNERPKLEQLIFSLKLSKRVFLPGRVGSLADWYESADILTLTSENEGFPNVILEALAHGCPVISVDCDTGPRDIIKHGENGLLIPQNDPGALAAGLDCLMSDEVLRKRLAMRAPEVLETYSPERVFTMWRNLLTAKSDQ